MVRLTVRDCLAKGWNTFKSRPWLFIQAGLLLLLVNIAMSSAQSLLEKGGEVSGEPVAAILIAVSAFLSIGISFLISMGETAFFLRSHEAPGAASLKDLWHPQPYWKFVGASLIAGAAVILGFVVLIIPGIIASILFLFVGYLVIDKELGPIAALKESIALTKGHRWTLFWLGLATLGLNILGFALLLVGLFVTIPVSFLAMTHAYRTLSGQDASRSTDTAEPVALPA